MTIVISDMQPTDIFGLWELEQEIWNKTNTPHVPENYSFEEFEQNIVKQRVLVAREADKVVGSLTYHVPGTSEVRNKQWFLGIGVTAAARGKGVGRSLIEALFEKGRAAGIGKISLRVMGTNPEALAFYKHLGFIEEAHFQREFWIDEHWVDDYQLAYYL